MDLVVFVELDVAGASVSPALVSVVVVAVVSVCEDMAEGVDGVAGVAVIPLIGSAGVAGVAGVAAFGDCAVLLGEVGVVIGAALVGAEVDCARAADVENSARTPVTRVDLIIMLPSVDKEDARRNVEASDAAETT